MFYEFSVFAKKLSKVKLPVLVFIQLQMYLIYQQADIATLY